MSGAWIALFVALWVVVLFLVVLVLGLIRKVNAPQSPQMVRKGASPISGGPLPGSPPPDVAGFERLSGDGGRGRLVLFLSSTCGPCRRLAGELSAVALHADTAVGPCAEVKLTLVTDPGGVELFDRVGASEIFTQTAGELSRAWSVPGTPFAVAMDATGIVRGSAFATTPTQIRELAASLTPATSPAASSATVAAARS